MPDPVGPRASGAHAATGTSSTAAAGSSDQHGDSTVELVSTAAEQLGQLVRQEIAGIAALAGKKQVSKASPPADHTINGVKADTDAVKEGQHS